jgi:hypothetical protein
MAALDIVSVASLTFGAHVSGPNQFLLANGLANSAHVPATGSGSAATVPVRSRLYAVTWAFERNTRHNFHLMKLTNNGRQFHSRLHFPATQTKSGVLIPDPRLSDVFDAGDKVEIMSTDPLDNFPGPIIVTLYLAAL